MISQLPATTPATPDARRLILASTSVYRRELLGRLRIPFDCIASDVAEDALAGELPQHLAVRLARAKAQAVAVNQRNALVIGSDQVLECAGQSLGKPGDYAGAVHQLRILSGQHVRFHTAVSVIDASSTRCAEDLTITDVRFRTLTDAMIENYLGLEAVFDCAGSAKVEALGIALLTSVSSSDPTAVIGLPLILLTDLLAAHGYAVLDASRGA